MTSKPDRFLSLVVILLAILVLVYLLNINFGYSSGPCYNNYTVQTTDQVQYVVSLDDSVYLLWQSEILLYNFQKLGIANQLWFSVLYPNKLLGPSKYALQLREHHKHHPNQVRFYHNNCSHWQQYKALCKPFGIAKLLEDIPSIGNCMFSMDPDILLTKPINFDSMLHDDIIYGSDTTSYLSYNHFHDYKKVSVKDMKHFTDIVGISLEEFCHAEKNNSVIGAQYLFKDVDACFFYKITSDAWKMYSYGLELQKQGNEIQVWCMEMCSMLFNCIRRVGLQRVKTNQNLDFNWATDSICTYDKKTICHMAGVTSSADGTPANQFDKQKYTQNPPWIGQLDFSYITNTQTCAQKWLEIIQEYAMVKYKIRIISPA